MSILHKNTDLCVADTGALLSNRCRVHLGVRVKGLSAAKDDQVCSLPSLAPVYVVVLVY